MATPNIKELLAQLKLYYQLDVAFAEKLDELEERLYRVEEDTKLLKAGKSSSDRRVGDLMMAFSSLKDEVKKNQK